MGKFDSCQGHKYRIKSKEVRVKKKMYDLHIHSLLSDGVLLPSEIARRYEEKGYQIIAITDHGDYSNIKTNTQAIIEFCQNWPKDSKIKVLPGVELTHIPLEQFLPLTKFAREAGIKIIIGHGESPVEPVTIGTNRAALLADINILAHPGNISAADALLAKEKGVFLEITTRRGHSQGNSHIVEIARKTGANLVIDNDSHKPEDILSINDLKNIALSAGLSQDEITRIYAAEKKFLEMLF
ncbi:MAG TPA: PHP domain-containing protein [Candidatus Omnitrophica bacterium]|nr:PHP domain-containing protein [Candidatus Omnitrophota bacterium]